MIVDGFPIAEAAERSTLAPSASPYHLGHQAPPGAGPGRGRHNGPGEAGLGR